MKQSILALALAVSAFFALASAALAQPAGGGVRAACQADIQKLCADAKPGPGGGMRQCMKGHWDQLSDGCKAAITKMRAEHQQQSGGNGGGQ